MGPCARSTAVRQVVRSPPREKDHFPARRYLFVPWLVLAAFLADPDAKLGTGATRPAAMWGAPPARAVQNTWPAWQDPLPATGCPSFIHTSPPYTIAAAAAPACTAALAGYVCALLAPASSRQPPARNPIPLVRVTQSGPSTPCSQVVIALRMPVTPPPPPAPLPTPPQPQPQTPAPHPHLPRRVCKNLWRREQRGADLRLRLAVIKLVLGEAEVAQLGAGGVGGQGSRRKGNAWGWAGALPHKDD